MGGFRFLTLGALVVAGSCFAQGSGFDTASASNFDFVEIDYRRVGSEISPGAGADDLDFDGFSIRGSYEFYDKFFAIASYTGVSLESNPAALNADVDAFSIGVGYVFGATDAGTFFGELTYNSADVSVSNGVVGASADVSGVGVGFGVRINTSQRTELKLGLNYIDADSDDDTSAYGEFVYEFFERFSAVVAVDRVSGSTGVSAGARYYFGW